jgi:hypothetical protein
MPNADIQLREFDVERIKRELEAALPHVREQIRLLREAKRVSWRCLNYEITV